MTNIQ